MMLLRVLVALWSCAFLPGALAAEQRVTPKTPAPPPVNTVIVSGTMEMTSTEKETTFTFGDSVTVTGTNLKLTCDDLVVVARRSGDAAATIGKQENFKSLVATGRVRILQNDREATCERAEVFPEQDKVVLSGNPQVRSLDGQYEASGPTMELHRGERMARIIRQGEDRPTITLPPLKDLGYEKQKQKTKAGAKAGAPAEKTPGTATAPGETPAITVPLTPPPR